MNIYFWQLLLSSPFISASDFGGDFSANGLSGASAPGATSGTMGSQAASAMSIGTGSSGAGDYASNYKTPNYTQYTQQDFKGKLLLHTVIENNLKSLIEYCERSEQYLHFEWTKVY